MTSEIRANTLKNRVGLGTVSFTNTGPVVSGIVTANSFSGPLTATSIDLNGDLDVDGHTNLDNVSIAGVVTATSFATDGGHMYITNAMPALYLTDTNNNPDWRIQNVNGTLSFIDATNSVHRIEINTVGNVSLSNDLDVDGHTNLDNVSIAGVTTFSVGPIVPNGQSYRGIINSGSQTKIIGGYISGSDTLRLGESMYLTTTGLGIGQPTPATTLEIKSDAHAQTTATIPTLRITNDDGSAVANDITGSVEFHTEDSSDPNHISGFMRNISETAAGVNYSLIFGTKDSNIAGDATEKVRILSSGNVGIGTDNPQYLDAGFRELTISGASEGAGLHLRDDNANVVGGFFTSDNTNAMIIRTRTNHPLMFRTNNTERLRIDSDGAVILKNTAAATSRSDFLGSLKPISQIASTWNAYHSITRHDAGSSYGPYLMLAKNRNDAYNSNGVVQDNDELGNIAFLGNDGSVFREGARIRGEIDGTPASNQMPTALGFWTNAGGGLSERLRIERDGTLTLKNNSGMMIDLQSSAANGSTWIEFSDTDGTRKGYLGYGSSGNNKLYLVQQKSDNIELYSNNSTRFLIQSDGMKRVQNGNLNIYETYISFSGSISTPATAAAIYRPADNQLAFSTANNQRALITNTNISLEQNIRLLCKPNSTWSAGVVFGGNGYGGSSTNGSCAVTNGNFHIDARSGSYGMYLNWYAGGNGTYFGNGGGSQRGRIDGAGNLTLSGTYPGSDLRLKENIQNISGATDTIKSLVGKTFTWKAESGLDSYKHYGFIAQEVQKVVPDLVKAIGCHYFDKDDNLIDNIDPTESDEERESKGLTKSLTVNSEGVTPILVEAMKELIAKVETLEAEVATLKGS